MSIKHVNQLEEFMIVIGSKRVRERVYKKARQKHGQARKKGDDQVAQVGDKVQDMTFERSI